MGIVEYLLILVLTVALVMALSKGIGKPLQAYIKGNIIDVVGCMLRVGQFPTQSLGLCQEAVKLNLNFNGSVPDSSSPNTSDGSGANGSGNNADNDRSKNDSNSDGDGSSSDSDSGSSSRSRFRSSRSTGSLSDSSGDDSSFSDGSATRKIKINSNASSELGTLNNSELQFDDGGGQTVIVRKIRRDGRIGGSFFLSDDEVQQQEEEKASAPTTRTKPVPVTLLDERVTENSFSIPKQKRRGPQGMASDTEVEFSFFGLIKWGIIIAIIVAFAMFTLSQLNSIRKGWTE